MRSLQADAIRPVASSRRPAAFWNQRFWSTGLALAASLLVMFSLGLFLGRDHGFLRWLSALPGNPPLVVGNRPSLGGAATAFATGSKGGSRSSNARACGGRACVPSQVRRPGSAASPSLTTSSGWPCSPDPDHQPTRSATDRRASLPRTVTSTVFQGEVVSSAQPGTSRAASPSSRCS